MFFLNDISLSHKQKTKKQGHMPVRLLQVNLISLTNIFQNAMTPEAQMKQYLLQPQAVVRVIYQTTFLFTKALSPNGPPTLVTTTQLTSNYKLQTSMFTTRTIL